MKTSNNTPANNKIQDFGQKIGGARKDYAKEAADLAATLSGLTAADLESLSLAKVMKADQIKRLAKSGAISAPAACASWALLRTIPAKPATSWKVGRWAREAATVLQEVAHVIGGGEINEKVKKMAEYRVLMAAGYPGNSFSFGKYHVKNGGGYYSSDNGEMRVVSNGYYRFRSMMPEAVAAFVASAVAKDAATRAEGATFELYRASDNTYYAAPKGKYKICVKEWATAEGARAGMANVDELRKLWDVIRNTPALRRTTNRARVGIDYRGNADTTPETFAKAFPFRGVEFGNWLTQTDRVTRLNETYDALHDLCELCGLTADAVTLKGWLAMAFGSRGIHGAAAHFEHGYRVINLTKEHGAGSLAHEWFHALDAFTAARFTDHLGEFAVKDYGRLPDGELREAAKALYIGLMKSPFFGRSEGLDYIKSKTYYATIQEMAARAFEVYIIELAKNQGWRLDFLANVATPEEWTEACGSLKYYPYPTSEEVAELAPLFARFLTAAAGAKELSQDVQELFAAGRTAMEEQRKNEAERLQAAAQEKEELKQSHLAQCMEEMQHRADEVCRETGATWSHVFASAGRVYAVGGGAGFVFNIWANGHTGFHVLKVNSRLKKSIRTAHRCYLEIKPGVNIEDFARKDLEHGFTGYSLFYEVFKSPAYTWTEFYGKHSDEIHQAKEELAQVVKKNEPKKAATATKDHTTGQQTTRGKKYRQSEENGGNVGDSAPAPGLSVVEMPGGGVAVVGEDWKDTYYHKREIKAHGCTWNKDAKQWQATEPEAVASIRAWFGLDAVADNTMDMGEDSASPTPSNGQYEAKTSQDSIPL